MTLLITGATGKVGRAAVEALLDAGHGVRGLSRDPAKASLPSAAEVVAGDLATGESLDAALEGVEAMHLIAFGDDAYTPLANPGALVERAVRAGVRHFTVLTGTDDELAVLGAVQASGAGWTHVRPTDFMANVMFWAESIREDAVMRAPFGGQPHAMVHEADVGAVIAAALVDDRHAGASYKVTGPEALSRADAARELAAATGRHIEFVELSEDEGREQLRDAGFVEDVIDAVMTYGRNPPPEASTVLDTVQQVTGRPARRFAQWAAEHADDFRTGA